MRRSMCFRQLLLGVLTFCSIFVSWKCGWAQVMSAVSPTYGGEYNIPLDSEPDTLDPAYITDIYSVNVAMNVFDGLVEFDKDLNLVPAIAEIWKISRDHRTYTFLLRKGVKFHNGREITAEDFVFSFTRILDAETKSPVASLFFEIEGAEAFHEGKSSTVSGLNARDSYTLEIRLEEPFAPFLSILAMANAKVIPKECVDTEFGNRPVGSGPFRFYRWERGREIVLGANNEYFAGRPFLDTLCFRIYQNIEWEKIFNDFKAGILDQSLVPSRAYDMVISVPEYIGKYTLITKPTLNLVYIGMNVKMPPFNDVRVRQAISYAVDTEKIVAEITKRGSIPVKGPLPPGIAGFDPDFKGYSYNPQKAKKLLEEAGYPQGSGIPPLEIWTVSKAESVREELKAYQKYFADLNISLTLKTAENWKEFVKLINEKKVPLYYAAWYADYPDPDNFLNVLFHSQSKTNRMSYHNPEIDYLLENARRETDYMKRVSMYRRIQEKAMDDAPVICQHVNSFNYLFQPWVKGVEVSYLGSAYISLRKVWFHTKPAPTSNP